MDGRETSYEGGTLSVRDAWLDSIIAGAGDFDGLIAYLRHSYNELLALVTRFDDETGNRKFQGRICDGKGNVQLEQDMSFAGIVTRFLVAHMRNHTKQIESLSDSQRLAAYDSSPVVR